jgi:hypothetical protein
MALSDEQTRIAGKLGERLAAGDFTAIEDIRAVITPIIREGDEEFGRDVIMQILFGMMEPSVFEAMSSRLFAWAQAQVEDPASALRDRTELAYIKKKMEPKKTREGSPCT